MEYNYFTSMVLKAFRNLNNEIVDKFDYSDYKNSINFEVYREYYGYHLAISIHTENSKYYISFLIHKNKKLFDSKKINFKGYDVNAKELYDTFKFISDFFEHFVLLDYRG